MRRSATGEPGARSIAPAAAVERRRALGPTSLGPRASKAASLGNQVCRRRAAGLRHWPAKGCCASTLAPSGAPSPLFGGAEKRRRAARAPQNLRQRSVGCLKNESDVSARRRLIIIVIAGLVPAIPIRDARRGLLSEMPATSAGMTELECDARTRNNQPLR